MADTFPKILAYIRAGGDAEGEEMDFPHFSSRSSETNINIQAAAGAKWRIIKEHESRGGGKMT